MSFLSATCEWHDGDLAGSAALLNILNKVLGVCGLAEVEANKHYYGNAWAEQLTTLAVAQMHMAQMYDMIGPRCSRWLGEGNGGLCYLAQGDQSLKDFFANSDDEGSDNVEGLDGWECSSHPLIDKWWILPLHV